MTAALILVALPARGLVPGLDIVEPDNGPEGAFE
jgi:hypothetical protein